MMRISQELFHDLTTFLGIITRYFSIAFFIHYLISIETNDFL